MTPTSPSTDAELRNTLRDLIGEIVGPEWRDDLALHDDILLAYDVGLESIELVVLMDGLRQRLGIGAERLMRDHETLADALGRLTVRWVLDQAQACAHTPR